MAFYILTTVHGQGPWKAHITHWPTKLDFWAYCAEVMSCRDGVPKRSHTIDQLCEVIYDNGPGFGARSHKRVSVQEARDYIKVGAQHS